MNIILRESMSRAEAHFRQVHERRVPLMRFLTDLQIPLPKAFHAAAEFTINTDLQRAFEAEDLDMDKIPELLEEAKALRVTLDLTTLEYNLRRNIEGLARRLATSVGCRLDRAVGRRCRPRADVAVPPELVDHAKPVSRDGAQPLRGIPQTG